MSAHGPAVLCSDGCGRWTLLSSVDPRCLHCLMEAAQARESRISNGGSSATAAPDAAPLPVVGAVVEEKSGVAARAQGAGASLAALRRLAPAPAAPDLGAEALAVALHGAFVELENDNPDAADRDASWERLPAGYRRHLVKVARVALGALRDAGVSL